MTAESRFVLQFKNIERWVFSGRGGLPHTVKSIWKATHFASLSEANKYAKRFEGDAFWVIEVKIYGFTIKN